MQTLWCLSCTSHFDLFLAVQKKKIHGISLETFPTMYEIKQLEPEQAAHTKSHQQQHSTAKGHHDWERVQSNSLSLN